MSWNNKEEKKHKSGLYKEVLRYQYCT